MIIVNGKKFIVEDDMVLERTYDGRRSIEVHLPAQEGLTHEVIAETFADGAQITNVLTETRTETRVVKEAELISEATETEPEQWSEPEYETVEVEDVKEYDLSDFCVAGDIVDKRDGSFVVYMGVKTEAELLNEQMAELLLDMIGGDE